MRTRSRTLAVTCAVAALALGGCTVGGGSDGAVRLNEAEGGANVPLDNDAEAVAAVVDDPAGAGVAAVREFYGAAPFVVLAPEGDLDAVARAASVAVATWTPMLVVGAENTDGADAVAAQVGRLGAQAVLSVGGAGALVALDGTRVVEAPAAADDLSELVGVDFAERAVADPSALVGEVAALEPGGAVLLTLDGAGASATPEVPAADGAGGALPAHGKPGDLLDAVVFADGGADNRGPDAGGTDAGEPGGVADMVAATATARATGATVLALPAPDPRANGESVAAVKGNEGAPMYGLGAGFGTDEEFAERLTAARTVPELPGGGQLVFPGRRMIAMYGHPGVGAMGVLGEQGIDATLDRAASLAATYDGLSPEPVIPALEVIVTVATASAGEDNQYSAVSTVEEIRPWVEAAGEAGTYVVLDLQPGRTDFLTQAKVYEELLLQPHVGLALDPEWRLKPGQVHLNQVGQVSAAEVNTVVDWLADLTERHNLPQKLLILHQFQTRMVTDRDTVDLDRDSLAVLVHADGHGAPGMKMDTWDTLRADLPAGMWLGWKNFYDEDSPTFTPAQTMDVRPRPWFVSYQ